MRCQHMALLPAASHAHRPCQPALPICRATGAGADMTQSLSTEHQPPSPFEAMCFACATLLQTLFTSSR